MTSWRWWVCGLLLLATMINYMDRLTLNLLARHVSNEFCLDAREYATLESGFALAFAGGALLFGFLADRFNVYWIYPLAVLAWSAAGFVSGLAATFEALLLCRVALGLAESANWPCALRTTQRVLPPEERGMGNSILQSGAALGAIALPIVLELLFREDEPSTWRRPFLVVGAFGALWVFLWWAVLRPADLALPAPDQKTGEKPPLRRGLLIRRLAALGILVVTINMTWHFLRAWGPLYLQKVHHYTQTETNRFSLAYYLSTDAGALAAGAATLWLARRGLAVHSSRVAVYLGCALLCCLCALMPLLEGRGLVAAFLLVGFGSLGVFPCYYSFSQDVTEKHQGKLTGSLGFTCWIVMAGWQWLIGWLVDTTGSYTVPFVISAFAPLLGFVALALLWGRDHAESSSPR